MGDEPNAMKPASREQAVFAEALQCASPESRAAYLDGACGADAALRGRVDALLRAAENAGDFLEQPPVGLSGDTDDTSFGSEHSEKPGDRIGRYKLLEKIGEGGCGVVYMAEQEEPVRRRVALKVIKLGMDTKSVVARFEAERQALALMDHSNIAKVFDGGATQTGRPYFVMELVRGVRITEFCEAARLSTEARLGLFVLVCQAVQHAHQKGIIHRDLKPSNILVTVNDGVAVPKVIDFGIAKATGQRLTDKTLFTQFHSFIGTPAYTSPEQAEMSSVDVDTRSDIYSLGVLLYELLTGKTPFDGEELLRSGLDEMRRIIRETAPPRPSTRLTQLVAADARRLHQAGQKTEAKGQPPTKELISAVRGDLDWIVMKCLEKDRARRYETANGLAADIQRHLAHEPIEARAVGVWGRFWRWRRRRPAVAALSAGLLLLLIVVAVGSAVAAWRVASARRAEHEQRTKAESANRELRGANTQLADTVDLLELRHAEDLFRVNDSPAGVAQLVAMLRLDASNHIAASRLVSALVHRNWALPATVTMRHPYHHVTTVSFSPDGRQVLSASHDRTAKIWDAATGEQRVSILHADKVRTAQYNAAGNCFVTASADGTARVWNATNGQPITPPLPHHGDVIGAEFSPDGQSVLTGSEDKMARIWDANRGELKRELHGHSGGITTARFSPDGQMVATGSKRGGIRIWSADTGRQLHGLGHGNDSPIAALAFSPDGGRLVSASYDNTAQIWDTVTGHSLGGRLHHSEVVNHAVFSPDGKLILTSSDDYSARLWDARTSMPAGQPMLHGGVVRFGAFSADGKVVATAGGDLSARLWEVPSGRQLCQPLEEYETMQHVAFSPDGHRLVTASRNGIVQVWNIQPRRFLGLELRCSDGDQHTTAFAFDPQGETVLTGSLEGIVQRWNCRTGQSFGERIKHERAVICVDFSPDGRRTVTTSDDGNAYLSDATSGKVMPAPLRHAKGIGFAQFSPDSTRVVTASEDGTARVWDATTGQPVTPPLEHEARVSMAKFSPDGRWVVTASDNWSARVWDAATGRPVTARLPHIDSVRWAEFSPDGQRVVTASTDNSARMWDARTGQQIGRPLQHARTVCKAVFSPDGLRVATASVDLTAGIWDAQSGEASTPPLMHDKSVTQVCFSPDGRRILTSGWAGTARLWEAQTGRPLTEWLNAGGRGLSVGFDPTGQRMVGFSANGNARVWDVPNVPVPVPTWFLDLAEAAGRRRLSARGHVKLVGHEELEVVAQRLAGVNEGDFYQRVARWFLADPAERPVSPF